MFNTDRKPDFENESFRAWTPTEDEKLEIKPEEEKHPIEMGIGGGQKIKLIGFNKVIDKESDEVMFAYKVKDKIMLLYWINPKPKFKEKGKEVLRTIKSEIPFIEFKNVDECFESIKLESHTLAKLTEKEKLSMCCGEKATAPGYPDSDICSKCKEHGELK